MKRWTSPLTRLLPATMFGRLGASLLLVVGVTFAVVIAVVLRDRGELSLRVGSVSDSAHRIAYLTRQLETLHGDERSAELARLAADPTLQVAPDRYPERSLSRHELAAIERAFAAELHDRLGGGYRFHLGRIWDTTSPSVIRLVPERHASGTTALDVSVELRDGETLVFRVAPPVTDSPLPWPLFVQLGAVTTVLVVVLFLVTRSITRPLSKLARAADGVGRNVRHPPLAEEGVLEIRE